MEPKGPAKLTYKKKEVIQLIKLDGRVLDFWEKEFGVIHPVVNQSGEKYYSRRDLEAILRIRQLLLVEKKSKEEVRRLVAGEFLEGGGAEPGEPAAGPVPGKAIRNIRKGLQEILTLLDKSDKK